MGHYLWREIKLYRYRVTLFSVSRWWLFSFFRRYLCVSMSESKRENRQENDENHASLRMGYFPTIDFFAIWWCHRIDIAIVTMSQCLKPITNSSCPILDTSSLWNMKIDRRNVEVISLLTAVSALWAQSRKCRASPEWKPSNQKMQSTRFLWASIGDGVRPIRHTWQFAVAVILEIQFFWTWRTST